VYRVHNTIVLSDKLTALFILHQARWYGGISFEIRQLTVLLISATRPTWHG